MTANTLYLAKYGTVVHEGHAGFFVSSLASGQGKNFNANVECWGVSTLRLLGLFGDFGGKVWALGAKVWDPMLRVQEP